jgi:Co/Zn/Cd efflux system component
MDAPLVDEVREILATLPESTVLRDLHVWRVGKGKYACIVSLADAGGLTPADVRERLAVHDELVHVTVEMERRLP